MSVEWMEILKPGDTVFVSRAFSRELAADRIKRTTKVFVETERNGRFSRRNGNATGSRDSFSRPSLLQATAKRMAEYNVQRARHYLNGMQWNNLDAGVVLRCAQAVREIMDAGSPTKERP